MAYSKFYQKIYQGCNSIEALKNQRNKEIAVLLLTLLRDFVITGCSVYLYYKQVLYAIPILLFGLGILAAGILFFIIDSIRNICSYLKRLKQIHNQYTF